MAQNTVHVRRFGTGVAVTPNDTTNIAPAPCDAFYVGGAGTVVVIDIGGTTLTLTGALAGTVYPLRVMRVLATGTTATGIIALYD
jgi:hypothetical protein